MKDTELYRRVLGLETPWDVIRVELSMKEQRVDVWVDHPPLSSWRCPECGRELPLYDHAEERGWRHLDTMQFLTYLHARPPRVECPEHGVRQVRLPWAEPHSRFTNLFQRLAIEVLQECTVKGGAKILRLSWDEAWHVMDLAVERGLKAKPKRAIAKIGVDEKAVAAGQTYVTVVSDLERGTVEHLADERKQESLDGFFKLQAPEQLAAIEAVAMDMWDPFVNSVRTWLADPDRKIVFDRYHLMSHMEKAVDTVRKRENRALRSAGDDRLVGSKYLWLYSMENLPEKHRERFDALRSIDLKTARAWAIKENLRLPWEYNVPWTALRWWKDWYCWATHSRLEPVIAVAKMLKRRLEGVMAFFRHRVTNAVAEGLNSRIQQIRVMARGYRNRQHFKTAVYFHCGGLNLYPATHEIPG